MFVYYQGEFSRLYTGDELVRKLSQYQALYAIGFLIGPATPALFGSVHIELISGGVWVLNQNNFSSVSMALLMVFMIPAIYFGVHDLTINFNHDNEEDLLSQTDEESIASEDGSDAKNSNQHVNERSPIIPLSTIQQKRKKKFGFKDIFTNTDLAFLVLSSSSLIALASLNEIVINLTAGDIYAWSLTRLGIVTCVCVVLYSSIMLTIGNRIIQRFYKAIFVLSFVLQFVCMMVLFVPHVLNIDNLVGQHIQIIVAILINTFTGLSGALLARMYMFELVPLSDASYADGLRSFAARIVGLIAFFSGAWVYSSGTYSLPVISCFMLALAVICCFMKQFRPF